MVYEESNEVKKARTSLIQQALNEIYNVPDYTNFSSNSFYVIAKLGLQIKAKCEGLFTNDNQANPSLSQAELRTKVKEFIFKHIK